MQPDQTDDRRPLSDLLEREKAMSPTTIIVMALRRVEERYIQGGEVGGRTQYCTRYHTSSFFIGRPLGSLSRVFLGSFLGSFSAP